MIEAPLVRTSSKNREVGPSSSKNPCLFLIAALGSIGGNLDPQESLPRGADLDAFSRR